MIQVLNAATVVWLGIWSYVAVRCLASGVRNCLLFIFPIHFIFCGLPLLLDLTIGVPVYTRFPGFADAANDPATCVIYCLFVSACPVIWWVFAGPLRRASVRGTSAFLQRLRSRGSGLDAILVLILLLPVVLVLVSPDPSMYLSYSPYARQWHARADELIFHAVMVKLIQLGALAGAVLLYRARHISLSFALLAPVLCINCWLHGKRNIVAFTLFLLIYALWSRGALLGKRLFVAGTAAASLFLAFSMYYQTNLRFSESFSAARTFEYWIEGVRVDFGRDDVIKLNIFAELNPHRLRILDYRGESAAIIGTFFIPRQLWPGKPESYASRVMTAAMGRPSPGGGTMTTNVLAEAIANFGWLGVLAGPFIPVFICRVSDRHNNELLYLLTLFISTGMMVVSFSYWAHVACLWLGAWTWNRVQVDRLPRHVTGLPRRQPTWRRGLPESKVACPPWLYRRRNRMSSSDALDNVNVRVDPE